MKNIVAITVTYNRINTLEKTIHSLINQNYDNLNKIIIVDNNSNEDCKKRLKKIENLDNRIDILYLDENFGGAGGFYYGMKYAREKYDADGYWIMDDDAYPTKDCLNKMLEHSDKLENIGFICPLIYGIDNKEYQTYHHKNISTLKVKEILNITDVSLLDEITEIECNAFVGPLFPKQVVDDIGLPNKDLFIYGDDTEYTYRAVFSGYRGYLVRDAIIEHQDPPKQNNKLSPTSWWKEYYMFRNKFFFVKQFGDNTLYKVLGYSTLVFELLKKIIATIIKPSYRGYRKVRLSLLMECLKDGLIFNTGKTIDPAEYNRKLQST